MKPDISEDPDVAHLRDLARLLPPLTDRRFWDLVAHRHPNYVGKLGEIDIGLRAGDPERLAVGCWYLLVYFSNGNEDIWRSLDLDRDPGPYSLPGRYLAEDVCATAWRIFARYGQHRRDGGLLSQRHKHQSPETP